jgi:hypothetical protein
MIRHLFNHLPSGSVKGARLGLSLIIFAGLGLGPLCAQPAPREVQGSAALQARIAEFEASVVKLADKLNEGPPVPGLSPQKRRERVDFVVGNIRFVADHELAHALISELKLSVLGREEDTADVYAILKALRVPGDFSLRILITATKAWFLSARRDRTVGVPPTYYERHGLDEQRAYHIICLMVGSDPVKFKALADAHKLPEERRRSCGWDYGTAEGSWDKVMTPHFRAPHQPKTEVEVVYGEGKGRLEVVARSFREIRFLEHMAEFAAERYLWPAPIKMEMLTCGYANARWTIRTRTMQICYELVDEFARLFREQERGRISPSGNGKR